MKRIICMIVAMYAVCSVALAQSYHVESDGMRYRYSGGGVELVSVKDVADLESHSHFVVPDSVYSSDFGCNLAVVSVGDEVFAGCKWLESVTLPVSVVKIKYRAFYNCESLEAINLSECALKSIGSGAFANASSLTSVKLPETLKTIDSSAFAGTSSMTDVKLPETLETIGDYAFYGCGITEFITPEGVDSIGACAFAGPIKHFKMGKSLKKLGNMALFGPDIETVEWNDSITTIGTCAFYGADTTEIVLPKSIRTLQIGAFADMKNLKRVVCKVEDPADIDVHNMAFSVTANKEIWPAFFTPPLPIPLPKVEDTELTPVPEGCVLYVPAQSIELYRQADVWKEFAEIRAIDDDEETALEQLTPAAGTDGATYDLMCRRVESPRPGQLVVSGGKLRLIR